MPGDRFPSEFEDILTREGRRVLAGTHELCGALAVPRTRFVSSGSLVDKARAARLRTLLDRHLLDTLERIDRPIPPETIWDMTQDYAELLPKVTRVSTVYFDSPREAGEGGRARRVFSLTPAGWRSLREARDSAQRMWKGVVQP